MSSKKWNTAKGSNTSLPMEAEVVCFVQESPCIFSLSLRLVDEHKQALYRFDPGQFNMMYLYGVGEIPISIVPDPEDKQLIGHTICSVGRVTEGLAKLRPGDRLGLRGPYGRGWPLEMAKGKDLMVVTGGLGCAPVVALINHVLIHREDFGQLSIVQGVKHSDELIWRARYDYWNTQPNTQVLIAADQGGVVWPYHQGRVTDIFEYAEGTLENSIGMLCGPEGMLKVASEKLVAMGMNESNIYLSMERNMQCAIGHCGHCQYGANFICKDGPVFAYSQVKPLLGLRGV